MMRRRRGRIVNMSSVAALRGLPAGGLRRRQAGLLGFTRALARELARFGITVNAVAPGCVDTEMVAALPARRREEIAARSRSQLGQPEDGGARALPVHRGRLHHRTALAIDSGLTA
jgi:NAD(P)-dependent dehydrogenase (short-subunit alcohol dehydrogenase family)